MKASMDNSIMSTKPRVFTVFLCAAALALLIGCGQGADDSGSYYDSISLMPEDAAGPEVEPKPVYELDLSGENGVDLAQLAEYPQLKRLDLHGLGLDDLSAVTGCVGLEWLDLRGNMIDCDEYDAIAAALPMCEILWDVPLGGESYDCTVAELTLPDVDGAELEKLHYFTALGYVDATAVTDACAVAEISKALPECRFDWCVTLCGATYSAHTAELDLSGVENGSTDMLAPLAWFSGLEKADLRNWSLTLDEMNGIADSVPDTECVFSFTFAGQAVDSTVTELDIRGSTLSGTEDVMPYLRFMPQLTYLDMCGCGLSNEQMEELCQAYPNVKFVWIVQMRKWSLRTDTVAYSTKNASDSAVKLTTEDIQVLRYCTDLVALDLGHHLIDDISVIGELTELRALVLVDNLFSDLTPLEKLTKLEFVELYANPNITDIMPLVRHPSLKEINLSKCPGITDFLPFAEMTGIEMLYMNDTCCDDAMLEALRAALPNAVVHCDSIYSNGNGWRDSQRYKAMFAMFDGNFIHELFLDPESTKQ